MQIASSKKDPLKTLGTRISCETGTGLGGQRARWAKGKMGKGQDGHGARRA